MKEVLPWVRQNWAIICAAFSGFYILSIFVLSGAWYLMGDNVVTWVRAELGLEAFEERMLEAVGANRVIWQPPGQSYVKEPVEYCESGETCPPIVYVFTVKRTEVGAACVFVSAVPIFTAESGAQSTGVFSGPGRQFGTDLVRTEVNITRPANLPEGRTVLRLQLEYTCGGSTVYELTDPAVFTILP